VKVAGRQDQNLTTELTISPSGEDLSSTQHQVLQKVFDRTPVDDIADKFDVGTKTVYRILDGLKGEKKDVPKKYQVDKAYLKKVRGTSLNYALNERGLRVLASRDPPSKSDNGGRDSEVTTRGKVDLDEDLDSEAKVDWEIRPHYLVSKHELKRSPEGWGVESWFIDRSKVGQDVEVVEKQLPDGSTVEGRRVFYEGHKVELYENTVVVRLDFPEQRDPAKEAWGKYRRKLDEVVAWIEERFPLQVRSSPVNVEASISCQHWAHLENSFAEYVVDEGISDSGEGVLFMVRNRRGEPMAVVDCSTGRPEFEWIHEREAAHHLDNMKDLIMWGSYYEITPEDFSSLAWLRENVEMFEEVADRFVELGEVEDRQQSIVGVQEDVSQRAADVDKVMEEVAGLRSTQETMERAVNLLLMKELQRSRTAEEQRTTTEEAGETGRGGYYDGEMRAIKQRLGMDGGEAW